MVGGVGVLLLWMLLPHCASLDFYSSGDDLTEVPVDEIHPNASDVSILNSRLTSVRANTFQTFRRLQRINLDNNHISYISDRAFDGTVLSRLYISNNLLRGLPSFYGVRNTLSRMVAFYNEIETLNKETFYGCSKLIFVNLAYNRIAFISDDAFDGTIVSSLILPHNRLRSVPALLGVRSTLSTIDLNYNAIETLDDDVFHDYTNLRFVNLRHNLVSVIPGSAFNGTSSVKLYISNNRLRSLPSCRDARYTLDRLNADSNAIETLSDDTFCEGNTVSYVSLRDNLISFISDNAFNGASLVNLDISNNQLRTLPSFHGVKNTLNAVNADSNSLETLSDEAFRDLTALRSVSLRDNLISSISDYAFNGTSLKYLYISNNRLKALPSFYSVRRSLVSVNAWSNAIETVDDDTFRDIQGLRLVYLQDNVISFISDNAFNGTSLEYLYIANNRLKALPSFHSVRRSLLRVSAESNAIETVDDDTFRDIQRLSQVYLQDNVISFISDNAFNGTSLKVLNVSNNRLQALPSLHSVKNSLQDIYAANNRIEMVKNYEFQGFKYLSIVRLEGNQITVIPDGAFDGTVLNYLNVSHNRLTALPSLPSLKNQLDSFDAKSNFIEVIESDAFINTAIRIFKADNNQINSVPPLFFRNRSVLNEFSMTNNRLTKFPDFTYLPENSTVQYLYLSHNMITDLDPAALYRTPHLRILKLNGNLLTTVPIFHTSTLRTLCLQDNAIIGIPSHRFEGMNLISLNLSNNLLQQMPNILPLNASLATLDLRNNSIGPVSPDVILKLISPRLQHLDLRDIGLETIPDILLLNHTFSSLYLMNPDSMHCDCSISWIVSFEMETSYIANFTDLTSDSTPCGTPARLQGRELSSITTEDLCNPAPEPGSTQETLPTPTQQQQQQQQNDGGGILLPVVGASLGALLLLSVVLNVIFIVRQHAQRHPATSKSTEHGKGNSNEAYSPMELATVSRPESHIYAEIDVANAHT